ncbi:DMT family transporter [Aquimarina agarivorans]|uniref:DMT family transporter n=1 Tax=Aquimarina agarivorans TaxID=980584 RepID=UPI000248E5C4|nr:DMT family transporter [Aquimarina agarivorans]
MSYLLLSICASSVLFVVFKLFAKFKINTIQAIIFNYLVAAVCGYIAHNKPITIPQITQFSWFYYSLGLGLIFIAVFYAMAITTQRNGMSVVAVASKMSVVIPILFGVFVYNETIGRIKVLGILIALFSIYLVTVNPNKIKSSSLLFPILVFIGSGLIDTSLKFLQTNFVKPQDVSIFSATLFVTAGFTGILIIIFQALQKKFTFEFKNLIGGIVLGVCNYFSIYFLVQAISYKGMESSTLFTVNNVGVLLVTTILGVLLFKEKLTQQNKLGILLAAVGIVLVSVSGNFN